MRRRADIASRGRRDSLLFSVEFTCYYCVHIAGNIEAHVMHLGEAATTCLSESSESSGDLLSECSVTVNRLNEAATSYLSETATSYLNEASHAVNRLNEAATSYLNEGSE